MFKFQAKKKYICFINFQRSDGIAAVFFFFQLWVDFITKHICGVDGDCTKDSCEQKKNLWPDDQMYGSRLFTKRQLCHLIMPKGSKGGRWHDFLRRKEFPNQHLSCPCPFVNIYFSAQLNRINFWMKWSTTAMRVCLHNFITKVGICVSSFIIIIIIVCMRRFVWCTY